MSDIPIIDGRLVDDDELCRWRNYANGIIEAGPERWSKGLITDQMRIRHLFMLLDQTDAWAKAAEAEKDYLIEHMLNCGGCPVPPEECEFAEEQDLDGCGGPSNKKEFKRCFERVRAFVREQVKGKENI